MSETLQQLVERLCPEGVEYKAFFEVADYIRGITYNKSDEAQIGEYGIKVLRANNITLASNTLNFEDIKLVNREVRVQDKQHLLANLSECHRL